MTRAALALLVLAAISPAACGAARRADAPLLGDEDRDAAAGAAYFDRDDGPTRSFGHAAGAAQAAAIAAVVKRYYAAAAARDGTAACALTYYLTVETIPEEYGEPPGPRYLRGARTCTAVLDIFFNRAHRQLTAPVTVAGVRVRGAFANALVGFRTLPAGVVKLRREGRTWKVAGLLAEPIP
jgi:hypothetical protein